MRFRFLQIIPSLILLIGASTSAQGEPLPGFYMPGSPLGFSAPSAQSSAIVALPAAAHTTPPGFVCTTIDFEGVADLVPIPVFDDVSSPNWLGVIDADAGGSGNFAFEPSPSTIAFWLGGATGTGSSRDIVFGDPIGRISFFYASFVTVSLQAFDSAGNVVAMASGPPNFNTGPGGDPTGAFNRWDPISLQSTQNDIVRVTVSGAINQTGIDDLEICRGVAIDGVEFTQAIQDLQTVEELKADLAVDGEPPVPMVAGKPAVMRVYFEEVQTTTTLEVVTTVAGRTSSRVITLQPGCPPSDARSRAGGCQSADVYFTPPTGAWTAEIETRNSVGDSIETHMFDLESRDAEPLVLSAVRICDIRDAMGTWRCADNYATRLAALAPLLRKIAPTHRVSVVDSRETVRRDVSLLMVDTDMSGTIDTNLGEDFPWWNAARGDVSSYFGIFDLIRDGLGLEDRRFYGISRNSMPGGILGIADGIPSRGALSRSTATDGGVDVSQDTVAHETGHMLGRQHTNTAVPTGACGFAIDSGTNWPYPDNRLRSGSAASSVVEVGFDIGARRPIPGVSNYEIMSYCIPVWISSFTYNGILINALDKPFSTAAAHVVPTLGDFWIVSGQMVAGAAIFDPIYEMQTLGTADPGLGTHTLVVTDASGIVLLSRFLTPEVVEVRVADGAGEPPRVGAFAEVIPTVAGAARINLLDEVGDIIGGVPLGGAPPLVTFTFPSGGETPSGHQPISWTVNDADGGGPPRFWVQYSPDNGVAGSWQSLGRDLTDTSLLVDFDALPGTSSQSVFRILSSDGANGSAAISVAFSVARKSPSADIIFPPDGEVFRAGDTVWLQGSAFDPEDGNVAPAGLSWSSDLDGWLGNSESLPIETLQRGSHHITLTATDHDGNVATDWVDIVVAGTGPTVALTVTPLDVLPTTCVRAEINATVGSVPLSSVDYSLDGGDTFTSVPVSALPFRLIIPGSGFFHVVTRAFDAAGQLDTIDERFFTAAPCATVNLPPVANAGPDQAVECASPVGALVTLDGSNSSDPDGDSLSFSWMGPFGSATGAGPTVLLPLGAHVIDLVVEDGQGGQSSDQLEVAVADTTSPVIDRVTSEPSTLWPPNHEMIPVSMTTIVVDACDAAPICAVASISSNQQANGRGDGDTEIDTAITGPDTVELRAERAGRGDDRVYGIEVECKDASGNTSRLYDTVVVPHDSR